MSVDDLRDLYRTDPEAFMRLYRQMFSVQESLARTDINFFIQYVIKWEGKDEYVKQAPVHVELQRHIEEHQQSLIWGAVGIGKAQPLHSKVLTPTGWTTIGAIKVGDRVVDPDGGVGEVTGLTEVEVRKVYRITLNDGRSAEAADTHLWQVRRNQNVRLSTTERIAKRWKRRIMAGSHKNFDELPVYRGPTHSAGEQPDYDMYLVGLLHSPAFDPTTYRLLAPKKVLDRVRSTHTLIADVDDDGNVVYAFDRESSRLVTAVMSDFWIARTRKNQTIPVDALLKLTPEARGDFLSGVLDGCQRYRPELKNMDVRVTSSEFMASQLILLARSVGWWSRESDKKVIGLSIRPNHINSMETFGGTPAPSHCRVAQVRDIGEMKVRCINVSTKNHLYITDDGIVTHNCVTTHTTFIDGDNVPVQGKELYNEYQLGLENSVLDFNVRNYTARYVKVKRVDDNGKVRCTRLVTSDGHRTSLSNNHPVFANSLLGDAPWFEEVQHIKAGRLVATHLPKPANLSPDDDHFILGVVLGLSAKAFSKQGQKVKKTKGFVSSDALARRRVPNAVISRLSKMFNLFKSNGMFLHVTKTGVVLSGCAKTFDKFKISWDSTKKSTTMGDYVHVKLKRYRGRRTILVPGIKNHLDVAAGIFVTAATWDDTPPGVYRLNCSPQVRQALKWSLYLAGVSAKLAINKTEKAILIETDRGAEFLRHVAKRLTGFERRELEEHADYIVRQRMVPIGKVRPKDFRNDTGMQVFRKVDSWTRRTDGTQYRFSHVTGSRSLAGVRQTYAVEVESDTHTFITDGILTHNTQQVSIARTLFWLGQNPNYRILIFMSSQDMAKDTLRSIKEYILNSERYRRVFPHVQPGNKWAEYEILVKRQFESVTPSVRVIGTSTMIDGSRYDKIIGDDALSQKNTQTAGERDRTHKWIETVPLSRMADGCQVVIIGNAYHRKDSMHRLEELPGWKAKRLPARDPVTKLTLLPEIWPQERIELWSRSRTPSEVRRAIDVVPWTNEASKFKLEWFEEALKRGCGVHVEKGIAVHFRTSFDLQAEQKRVYELREKGKEAALPIDVVAGIDVGFGQTEDADETAVICGVPYDNGDLLVLYYNKGRLNEVEKYAQVADLHANFGATIFVEANFTQDYFYTHLRDAFPEATILPWRTRGDGTIGNKWHTFYGVGSLEFDYNRGKIILPCVPGDEPDTYEVHPLLKDLIDGFLNYAPDTAEHTHDGIMAHWIMAQGARIRGGVPYLAGLIGRHGIESDNPYSEYLEDEEFAAPSASGIDASSVWATASPLLRKLGITRKAKERKTEEVVYETFSGRESS